MSCLRHNHDALNRHVEEEKLDIHGPRAVAIPLSSPDIRIGTRRSTSRSSSRSHSSSNSVLTRKPMSIPSRHFEDAPPPLPPPRFIQDLEDGHDIVQELENTQNKSSDLPPIREGSSLLGGFSRPSNHQDYVRHSKDFDGDNERRPSTTRMISPATTSSGAGNSIPCVVRRPPSPSATNPMLHGERPLAQQNLNRSNQLYDRDILSKIGKANSPPCHLRADSADSPVMAQKLSLQTRDIKPHQQASSNETAATTDSTGRLVASPMSNGASPFSRQNWRDYNPGPQSPSLDVGASTMALDPELFVSKHPLLISASGSLGALDDTLNRSARSSYDQAMYTPISEVAAEDAAGIRSYKPEEQPGERQNMRQGVKRKSPHNEGNSDDRARPDICSRLATGIDARSPITSYPPKRGSVSSTASSAQQASFAPSSNFSAAPSSLTSISSYDTQSPKDLIQNVSYTMTAGATAGPATITTSRKVVDRIVPQKMSSHTTPQEIRPAPARIGNHYICACCPKKPKKFETEEQLRTHENEKQYSCNFCHNRFKNKNEAERHQNSLHLRKHSWSCSTLDNYEAAFSPSGAVDSTSSSTDACGYCGEEFLNYPTPDWTQRIDHLTNVHKFGECNSVKKFFRADHFRQHLKHSHAGKSGKWTNILEHACVRDEMAGDGGFSISTGESHQAPVVRPGTSMPMSSDILVGVMTSGDQSEEGL